MYFKKKLAGYVFVLFIFVVTSFVFAEIIVNNVDETGIALKGYDPVAYLDEGLASQGDEGRHFTYKGARYHFYQQPNKVTFVINKDRFIPQYGGYCAYAMSTGEQADIDPQAFTIHNDKIYLNASQDVRDLWLQDLEANIAKADEQWEKLISE